MGPCSSKKSKPAKPTIEEPTNPASSKQKSAFTKQRTDFKVGPEIFVTLKKGDILNAYKVERNIGEGASGKVSLVIQKSTGIPRAMKQIPKDHAHLDNEMFAEVDILRTLDHQNIVNIYELYQDKKFFYIITEYLCGGELFEKLKKLDHFTENIAANYMRQILQAVNYCHSRNITHRDLKPENILFESNKDNANLKVIDFGTAKIVEGNMQLSQRIGTPYYIAPEVIQKKYDKKCDLWSCGVILFVMLCGYPPFNGSSQAELYERITQGDFVFDDEDWSEISDEAKSLIRQMLVLNPERRISAEEALQHEWIKNNRTQKLNKKNIQNLEQFTNSSKLRAAIMQLVATQIMSNQEKTQLKKAFEAIDKNGDGTLSKEELINCYMEVYHDEVKCNEAVETLMHNADFNNSQMIDFSGMKLLKLEFIVASCEKNRLLCEAKLETAFKLFDKDGNGEITKAELQEIMGGLTLNDNEWNNVFDELDLNGDGTVTHNEFISAITKKLT